MVEFAIAQQYLLCFEYTEGAEKGTDPTSYVIRNGSECTHRLKMFVLHLQLCDIMLMKFPSRVQRPEVMFDRKLIDAFLLSLHRFNITEM